VGGGDDGRSLDFGMGKEDFRSSSESSRDITSSLGVKVGLIVCTLFTVGMMIAVDLIPVGFFTEGGELGFIGWNHAGEFLFGVAHCSEFCLSGDVCLLVGGENALGGDIGLVTCDMALGSGDIALGGGGDIALLLSGGLGGFMVTIVGISATNPTADAYLFSNIASCISQDVRYLLIDTINTR